VDVGSPVERKSGPTVALRPRLAAEQGFGIARGAEEKTSLGWIGEVKLGSTMVA